MMRFLTVFLALSLCAGAVHADHFGLYADAAGGQCQFNFLVAPPGNNVVYVIHKFNAGSTAAQFKVNDTSGLFPTVQTFPAAYLTIGTWNTDLSIAYGGCVIGDHVVVTLNFLWFGAPATCANGLEIVAAPTSPLPGSIALVDCDQPSGKLEDATGGQFRLIPGCPSGDCNKLAAKESTWGSVKALYR